MLLSLPSRPTLKIPTGTEIIVVGDSRTATQFSASSTFLENGKWGDRLTSASRGRLQFKPAGEFGVGGDTTADIAARTDAICAAAGGRMAYIFAGTNDRGSANMTLTQSIDNMTALLDRLLAAGAIGCCVLAEIQRFSPADLAGQQLTNHNNFHSWLLALNRPKVIIADAWDAVVSADYIDGLHPYTQGQHKIGDAFWAATAPYMVGGEVVPLESGGLLLNPTMTGTAGSKTGSASGNVADNWTLAMSATNVGTVTIAGSKPAAGGQQVDIAGLPTGTYGSSEFRQQRTLAAMGLAVGDTVEGFCQFAIDTATGTPGLPFRMRGLQSDGSTVTFTYEHGDFDSGNAAAIIPNGPWSGVRRIPPFVIPALTDSIRVSVVPQLIATAASLTARFLYVNIRKLPA